MYESTNKEDNIKLLNNYMFAKTLSMFEWANLPESIPQRELEKLLQVNGYAFITEVEGELYAFVGGLGGEGDAYGNPTKITIANPYLKFNKTLDLKKDGVLIINDDLKLGLQPFYNKQSALLVENDINMRITGINNRTQTLISAPDSNSKQSAEEYLKKIEEGKLGVIGTNTLFEGIQVHSGKGNSSGAIKDLLEYQQYLKSNLFNEVGLSSNFNMKRERLLSAEVDQSEDSLFPLVYNMLQCRLFAVEQINAMFQTDIDLDFGSVWHYKNKKLVDGVIENDNAQGKLDNPSMETNENGIYGNGTEQEETETPETVEETVEDVEELEPEETVEAEETVEEDVEEQVESEQDQDRNEALDPDPETVLEDEVKPEDEVKKEDE